MDFYKAERLLSVSHDAKTVKGEKQRWLTGILYLAPAMTSGFQVCPKATAGCMAACLNTAGRGIYKKTQDSRIAKTKWFFLERETFMARLVNDVENLKKKARKKHMRPCVRLNGTSDLGWEKIKCVRKGKEYDSIMEAFPKVKFYDYTAILGRKKALQLPNYSLTFSLKENNDRSALLALVEGYNVAVVMRLKPHAPKPAMWGGVTVADGDKNDLRFLDPKGCVVGLFAKGKAKRDHSGFVREINQGWNLK